jgi:hypothetical protein
MNWPRRNYPGGPGCATPVPGGPLAPRRPRPQFLRIPFSEYREIDDDRERITSTPFSPEETEAIRALLADSKAKLLCPRCRGELTVAFPIGGHSIAPFWEVRCTPCRRSVIVTELPREHRPKL